MGRGTGRAQRSVPSQTGQSLHRSGDKRSRPHLPRESRGPGAVAAVDWKTKNRQSSEHAPGPAQPLPPAARMAGFRGAPRPPGGVEQDSSALPTSTVPSEPRGAQLIACGKQSLQLQPSGQIKKPHFLPRTGGIP